MLAEFIIDKVTLEYYLSISLKDIIFNYKKTCLPADCFSGLSTKPEMD